jgi:hypothetical protein
MSGCERPSTASLSPWITLEHASGKPLVSNSASAGSCQMLDLSMNVLPQASATGSIHTHHGKRKA